MSIWPRRPVPWLRIVPGRSTGGRRRRSHPPTARATTGRNSSTAGDWTRRIVVVVEQVGSRRRWRTRRGSRGPERCRRRSWPCRRGRRLSPTWKTTKSPSTKRCGRRAAAEVRPATTVGRPVPAIRRLAAQATSHDGWRPDVAVGHVAVSFLSVDPCAGPASRSDPLGDRHRPWSAHDVRQILRHDVTSDRSPRGVVRFNVFRLSERLAASAFAALCAGDHAPCTSPGCAAFGATRTGRTPAATASTTKATSPMAPAPRRRRDRRATGSRRAPPPVAER